MASAQDRQHFARIAASEEAHRLDSIERASRRTASQNIAAAFALSEFAATLGTRQTKSKVSLAGLWRARHGCLKKQ